METYATIHKKITDKLEDMRNVSDEELYAVIENEIELAEETTYLPVVKKLELRSTLFDAFRRLDILQELLDSRDVTEIM